MSVYLDDDPIPVEGIEVMVSNLPAYGMGLKVGQSARPDDGRFVVTVMQRGSAFQMARYAIKLWRGTHERAADVRVMTASRVRIGAVDPSGSAIPFQVDGDPSGVVPVELECLPGSLEVFVSSDRPGGGCG
jgi:diacylglycerol kinase family enzyme